MAVEAVEYVKMLTPEEVASILQVSVKFVRAMARAGQLRAVKVGRLWRFRPEDVERFVNRYSTGR